MLLNDLSFENNLGNFVLTTFGKYYEEENRTKRRS